MKLENTDDFLPEKYYHVYNHAIGEENLFRNQRNYLYFLSRFKEYISTVCKCYAFCLMPNHFHFLIQIRSKDKIESFQKEYKPEADLSRLDYHKILMNQFSRMMNGYTQAYNKMYERKGALFLDYTRRKEVSSDKYLSNLIYYIHHNPVHHRFCSDIRDWEFSSYKAIDSNKPTGIEREEVIQLYGGIEPFERFHLNKQHTTGIINEFEF